MERRALLPCHSDIPASFDQFIDRDSFFPAKLLTVKEHHVRALRFRDGNPLKMFGNEVVSIINIFRKDAAKLIDPFIPFRLIGADQGMHGKHVHVVIMTDSCRPPDTVTQIITVNDMITADQARQIECLARSIDRYRALSRILTDALRRCVSAAVQQDI